MASHILASAFLFTLFIGPLAVIGGMFFMVLGLTVAAHLLNTPLPKPLPRATAGTLLNGPKDTP